MCKKPARNPAVEKKKGQVLRAPHQVPRMSSLVFITPWHARSNQTPLKCPWIRRTWKAKRESELCDEPPWLLASSTPK